MNSKLLTLGLILILSSFNLKGQSEPEIIIQDFFKDNFYDSLFSFINLKMNGGWQVLSLTTVLMRKLKKLQNFTI